MPTRVVPGLLLLLVALVALVAADCGAAHAGTIDFDDLPLAPNSSWKGPALNGSDTTDLYGNPMHVGTFASGGAKFVNKYTSTPLWDSWSGFAYSNKTDATTAGYGNQFSAFPGSGFGGVGASNGTYGVGYGYSSDANNVLDWSSPGSLPQFTLPDGMAIRGAYFTNTTYTALTMRDGDSRFGIKKFGGDTGNNPDWFRLTIRGADASGSLLPGAVDFYLADFRSANNAQDYMVDQWTHVDLSDLSGARTLLFNLSSSDFNPLYGMNTPGYFAIDHIELASVPEPSTFVLLGSGLGVLGLVRYLRRKR